MVFAGHLDLAIEGRYQIDEALLVSPHAEEVICTVDDPHWHIDQLEPSGWTPIVEWPEAHVVIFDYVLDDVLHYSRANLFHAIRIALRPDVHLAESVAHVAKAKELT